jgi:hypothetical protein
VQESDRANLRREAPDFSWRISLRRRLGVRLGYDPISQREQAKYWMPTPSKTLPKNNLAEPGPNVGLAFDCFAPSPGHHQCRLQGVFSGA